VSLKPLALAAAAVLLFAGLIVSQNRLDQTRTMVSSQGDAAVYFPKPEIVRLASLGHINLTADYYWLKTIQYLGNCISRKTKPLHLYDYADFVTDISPQFFEAYYYPAAVMITDRITPQQNITLLEKGRRNLPNKGELAYLLGFSYYFFMNDREKAAKNLFEAAKLRNYAPYGILASRIVAEGNNPDLSLSFLQEMYKDPKLGNWTGSMNQMVAGLNQRKDMDLLNKLIEQFKADTGAYPEKLEQLVSSGLTKEIPKDPVGGSYFIDPQTHQAKSSKEFYTGVYRSKDWK